MANELERVAAANCGALVMVLTGSVHASKGPIDFGGGAIVPAAARLPVALTVSILADGQSGMSWNCISMENCGPSPLVSTASGPRRVTVSGAR